MPTGTSPRLSSAFPAASPGWYFGVLGKDRGWREAAGTMEWEYLLLLLVALWALVTGLGPHRLRWL